jgi:hypothetical protein
MLEVRQKFQYNRKDSFFLTIPTHFLNTIKKAKSIKMNQKIYFLLMYSKRKIFKLPNLSSRNSRDRTERAKKKEIKKRRQMWNLQRGAVEK